MGYSIRTLLFTIALVLSAILVSSSSHLAAAQSNGDVLEKKISRLQAKAVKSKGLIEMDSIAFDEVMAKPRNYSMVILFTAVGPEFNCVPCLNFDPEYKLVAKGWSKLPDKSKVFFGSIDFKVGQAVFQKFGMNSAPSVLFFPPSDSISNNPLADKYDFSRSGFTAEAFVNWVNSKVGSDIKVQRPIDVLAVAMKILGVLSSAGSIFILYTKAGKLSTSKYLWSTISLLVIFIMISGHMWNQIRNPPYTVPGRDGRPGFIAQGFQNQFGLETQVVAVIYAVLTGCVISLIGVVPRIENPSMQRTTVWVSMGLFAFIFSVLIQIFRVKNPGYPFTLLFS
ncbi:oligosaccharyl transferase subunit ost3/OST6 [Entomortierella beljakovae]|nr:oligosaccharyl transferase subunit ost3/OST6 [Entomortierella beljakovae]